LAIFTNPRHKWEARVKILRFISILLTALTLGLLFAHVLEIPGKLRFDGATWLTVQQNLYVGFGTIGAVIEIAAILAAWLVVLAAYRRGSPIGALLAAAIAASVGLGLWVALVAPVNDALSGWTPQTIPADWQSYRNQWELGHALHGLCFLLAFSLSLWSAASDADRFGRWNQQTAE
jgi:hypothetical protein